MTHGIHPHQQARARRRRRRRMRGWRYRTPANYFRRKYAPFWKVKQLTRRHHERSQST